MKEKLNQAKEWIKANKKRSAGILVAFLLIIGAAGIGIVGVNSVDGSKDADKVATAEKDTSKKTVKKSSDSKKASGSDKKKEEAASDEKKKADDAKEENDSAAADEKQTAENNAAASTSNAGASNQTASSNQAASSNSVGSGSGSDQTYVPPAEPAQPDPPAEQQVHTHSYTIPIQEWQDKYKQEERSICNGCGADITGDPWTHIENQMLAGNMACGGYHSEWVNVPDGQELVTVGWQCSCGATSK